MTPEQRPYFSAVKPRVQTVLRNLESPNITNWKKADAATVEQLRIFCETTREATASLGGHHDPEMLKKLNPDNRFQTHLTIMHAYVDVLTSYPKFLAFLEEEGLTPEFIHSLVLVHDYGRNVFNGPLSLKYIDGVSDGIVRKKMPNFPTEYLHTIKWLTTEVELPENDAELQNNEKIGLLLKAIDTLGKLDQNGELMDPDYFFSDDGPYRRWAALQGTESRFPFLVRKVKDSFSGKIEVTAKDYTEQDEAVTKRGIAIIEELTGAYFRDIREKAVAKIAESSVPNSKVN